MDKLKSRWMKRKDLDVFSTKEHDHILHLIGTKRNIAAVVENDNEILGCIVYRVLDEIVLILKISFLDEDHMEFMLKEIKEKFKKSVSICVSEYDTKLHLALRDSNFRANKIVKNKDRNCDFYVFDWHPTFNEVGIRSAKELLSNE